MEEFPQEYVQAIVEAITRGLGALEGQLTGCNFTLEDQLKALNATLERIANSLERLADK